MSRTTNSLRNAGTAIGGQLLNNVLKLVCRTAFIYTLGQEYLGISSLYANILTILNITELGFASAVTYSLYDPLARDDKESIRYIMAFFRTAYRVIGLVVLVLGLGLMPLLPKLMTGVTDKVDIYQYYLIYLAQTVVSYLFFAYKSTLLVADQQKYAVDLVNYLCQVVMNLAQIAVLFLTRSFLLYTLLAIVTNIVQNITTAILVDRRYPYLKGPAKKLTKAEGRQIVQRVYAASLYKVSTAVGVATDNLVISSMVSVLAVGLYNNYAMIVGIIQTLLSSIFQGVSSSLGNLYATESREKNEFVFRSLNLLNNFFVTTCSVCFLILFQPFITLWVGKSYLLPFSVVVTAVVNFATNYLQNVVQIYKNASGVFVRGKYRALATAVLNLGISILLAKRMGITGVLLGSIISRMVTTWWFDGWLLYRAGFGMSPWPYFRDCFLTGFFTAACYGCVKLLFFWVKTPGWGSLLLMGFACALIPSALYFAVYCRSEEFAYLKSKGMGFVKKLKK